MTHSLWRVSTAVLLWVAAWSALAAPTVRMESRAAPSEEERPRAHAPSARWLSGLRHAKTIELATPPTLELEKRAASSSRARPSAGFGRTVDVSASRMVAARGESTLRFSVKSPTANHLRGGITFSDSPRYRVTSYRPKDESHAVSVYRTASLSELPETVWTPITDGDTQIVVVERLCEVR